MTQLVIFPLAENSAGLIEYPDAIGMFSNTDLTTVPGSIIAIYHGALTTLTPYAYTAPGYGTVVTLYAFLERFTQPEMEAINAAAGANASIATGLNLLATAAASNGVNLASTSVAALMAGLVAANLITAARSTAILTAPVTQSEAFTG